MPFSARALVPLLAFALLAAPAALRAANFTVDDTGEAIDATPGDGFCATAGAKCTLRAAIQEANALAGADTVALPDLPSAGMVTHYVQTALLPVINGPLTVTGTSPTTTRIESGGPHQGLFYVVAAGSLSLSHATLTGVVNAGGTNVITGNNASLTLDDLVIDTNTAPAVTVTGVTAPYPTVTITNSTLSHNSANFGAGISAILANVSATNVLFDTNHANQAGGAAYVDGDGTAVFTGCQFTGNDSAFYAGAITSNTPHLTIASSTFTDNHAATHSGALHANGVPANGAAVATTITDCTFDGNTAGDGSHPDASGGAVNAQGSTVALRSTFSDNHVTGQGGAVYNGGSSRFVATDCTFSGNGAGTGGGALYTSGNGRFDLQNVTVTNNSSTSFGGGGIYVSFGSSNFKNTIIAGNTGAPAPDCAGTLVSLGYDLVGDGTGCLITAGTGDQVGSAANPIDPHLVRSRTMAA